VKKKGKLFLIPNLIAEGTLSRAIPVENAAMIRHIKHFASESPKGARQYLKFVQLDVPLDEIEWYSIHKKKGGDEIPELIALLKNGTDVGVISDAGCPAIADPGENLIYSCHIQGIEIIPLVGPSSIILSLMASGFNGQDFHFVGYLPKDKVERMRELKKMEEVIFRKGTTYIFIETPYRNIQLLEELIKTLDNSTKICVAAGLTSASEFVKSQSVGSWKTCTVPNQIQDIPAIFLLGK
jgi:16S rRNA (cytidine1402-2'-O)-methyltransferase